jgi:predicted nucleic acid-binding protein
MFYLDSAAIVKLVHPEAESETLRSWLAERAETGWVSSVLAEVESFRALARHSPGASGRLPAVLDLIEMVEIDPAIRIAARAIAPATVRSLDAIHLATALRFGEQLTSFVTYDKRLADAADGAGLRVDMPAR